MQCGHFYGRSIGSLRFNEKNCNCQCKHCNEFLGGNITKYELNLKLMYGDGVIDELRAIKNTHLKLYDSDYERLIKLYKQRTKEL